MQWRVLSARTGSSITTNRPLAIERHRPQQLGIRACNKSQQVHEAVAGASSSATSLSGSSTQEATPAWQEAAAGGPSTSNPFSTSSGYAPPSGRRNLLDSRGRLMLKGLTLKELEAWCATLGESPKRALQIWRWMYADAFWIKDLQDTFGQQNGLSQKFIDRVKDDVTCDGGLELQQVVRAKDGTRKLVFKLTQGEAAGGTVETVLIPVVREAGLRDRITLCVSSQVGCAMNCQFCYTGRMGLLGNLSTAQIVEQVVAARRFMAEEGDKTPLTNLVFMGMGEPLHNLEAVLASIEIMCCHLGLHMSHNKVTVSTVGLVKEMREVVARSRAQLALSLHATTDEVRNWIVPVNRRYPLSELLGALAQLFPADSPEGRSVLIEYTMLRGINDTEEDARRLLKLLEPVQCKVNLIVFNAHQGTRFQPSHDEQILAFRSILIQGGRVCTIRDSRGDDEMAACGQLGALGLSFRPSPLLEPPERFRDLLLEGGALAPAPA